MQLNADMCKQYVASVCDLSTGQLQDDYMMIWHQQPRQGYGELLPWVREVSMAIITELAQRAPVPHRPRLIVRFPQVVPENHDPCPILKSRKSQGALKS